jgi:hypothetical protein
MAERKKRRVPAGGAPAEGCLCCRLSQKLERNLEKHAGVVEHFTTAKRELLEAVREFVDNELDALERALRNRKGKPRRVTRIEVE